MSEMEDCAAGKTSYSVAQAVKRCGLRRFHSEEDLQKDLSISGDSDSDRYQDFLPPVWIFSCLKELFLSHSLIYNTGTHFDFILSRLVILAQSVKMQNIRLKIRQETKELHLISWEPAQRTRSVAHLVLDKNIVFIVFEQTLDSIHLISVQPFGPKKKSLLLLYCIALWLYISF